MGGRSLANGIRPFAALTRLRPRAWPSGLSVMPNFVHCFPSVSDLSIRCGDRLPRHPALTACLFRQHDSRARDSLHGFTAEQSGVEFRLAPETYGAGALPAVRALAVADGANGLRRVGVMERHPLRVGLRGLRMNRLAVQTGDVRRWQIVR